MSDKLEITKNEASHLVNIINDYKQVNPNFLESTIHIVDETETTTDDVLAKLVRFITE